MRHFRDIRERVQFEFITGKWRAGLASHYGYGETKEDALHALAEGANEHIDQHRRSMRMLSALRREVLEEGK